MKKPVVIFIANRGYALASSRTGLIRRFLENGWQVVLATADDTESRSLCELGAHLEPLDIDRGGLSFANDLRAFRRLSDIFNKWNPVLVHQFHAKPVIFGSIAAKRCLGEIRVVNTITGLGHAFVTGGVAAHLSGLGYKYALPKADMTIFQNRDDQALFLRKNWVSEKKACLVPGSGVDMQRFQMTDRMSHTPSRPVTVMLGRLLGQKGVREFGEVATRIRLKWPKARFLWAGEEDLVHPDAIAAEWFNSQSDVEYLGRLDDVVPTLEQADLLLFTSYYREGVPRVILEAAATGLPTVGFDVPGVREAVLQDQTGYLVPQGDLDSMTEFVTQLLGNTEMRSRMGNAAREMVEKNFDIHAIQERYLQIYRGLGVDI